MEIQAGDKIAKIIAARLIETPKGSEAVEVDFSFMEGDKKTSLPWQGYNSPAALEFTKKTLKLLGYNGSEAVNEDGIFTDPKAFSYGKEFKLVVVIDEVQGDNGKVYKNPKIKYVNGLGGGQYAGLSVAKVKSFFKRLNGKADTQAPAPFDQDEEVPF